MLDFWFKPRIDEEKELLRHELVRTEQALLMLAQDMHDVYPKISDVAVSAEVLVTRYKMYASANIRPKLPKY